MAPNNEHHYDTHRYAGDQAADTRRVMNHMPDEDRSTTQEIQQSINASQAAALAPEVRMGDDRVIGNTPNWDGYTSEGLHKAATENNVPSTADNLGRAFNDGGNSLAEAANALFEAVNALDGAWSGVAADSAKGALSPLAQAAGVAGQTAQMMGVRMSQQSVAATEVRKLPPPKEFDQQQSLNAMVTGGPAAMQQDLKAQKDAAEAVKREQIAYLNAYTASMSAVDAQTPSFVPPKERIGGGGGDGNHFSGGNVAIPTTHDPSLYRRGTTTGAPTGRYTGVAGPGADQGGYFGDDGQTDQSGYTPVPGLGTGASGFNPGQAPTSFGTGGGGAGGPGGIPSSSVPGAGAGGFGGGFGSFGGAGGGNGAGAGAGVGAGAGNAGATGPKGMGPGGMSSAGGGRGGASGPGGAPRGKGDREEDEEHNRPAYLVEGDPESTFGNDQLTAPAVIGGDDE
jgi:hypothetical protein